LVRLDAAVGGAGDTLDVEDEGRLFFGGGIGFGADGTGATFAVDF
jgi:hypothetical protein